MRIARPRPSFVALATFALFAVLPLLVFAAAPERGASESPATEELDRYDRVVRDADGHEIDYRNPGLTPSVPPDLVRREGGTQEDGGGSITTGPVAKSTDPLAVELDWHYSIYGTGIGATGLHLVDPYGYGSSHLLLAGASEEGFFQNRFWYLLQPTFYGLDGKADKWAQVSVGPLYDEDILALRAVDLDGDDVHEIVVGFAGEIRVYQASPTVETAVLNVLGSGMNGLRTADVDGDGALEHVYCDFSSLFVVDATTGANEQLHSYGCDDLALGDVDGDGAVEIVLTSGNGVVLDGATGAVEWTNPSGFGSFVRAADVDGDGRDEIVTADFVYDVRVWDADTQSLAWSITADYDIDALQVADADDDGDLEVIYGDAQWGSIYVHDGATGALERTIANPDHGVTDLLVGDTDGDGTPDLVWGAGYSSTGADHLRVYDLDDDEVAWRSVDVVGPFRGLAHGDVDGDNEPDLVAGSFESNQGYGDGLWQVFSVYNGTATFTSDDPPGDSYVGIERIRLAQLDADPQSEVVLTTSDQYSPEIHVYDGASNTLERTITGLYGLHFEGLEIADVDLDGDLEIVASAGFDTLANHDPSLDVYDAATGALEWRATVTTGGYALPFLRVAQVDGDAAPEILVAEEGGVLRVYDGLTRAVDTPVGGQVTALDTADLDGDGIDEVIVGRSTGALEVVDPVTGTVLDTLDSGSGFGAIHGLEVIDLNSDGVRDLVFVASGRLRVLDGLDRVIVHVGGDDLGSDAGRRDSLVADDLDLDGKIEISLDLGERGFHVYRVPASSVDQAPSITIFDPADGTTIYDDETLLLDASAYDTEDGYLSSTIQWSSSLDGALGTGPTLHVSLSVGVHGISAQVTDSAGNTATRAVTVTVSPPADPPPPAVADYLARWRFDGDLTDASGNGHDGTAEGGVGFGEGVEEQGLFAAGAGDRVRVAAHPSFDTLSALTVTAWVKAEPDARWRSIVDKRDANADGFDLFLSSSGGRAYLRVNGSTLTGTVDVDDGAWHHVAGVWDGAELRLYVDGGLDATAAGTGTVSTTADLLVAGHFSNPGYDLGGYAEGSLDDVRVWDRALDAAEIATVFDEIPPRISDLQPSSVLPSGTTSTVLSLATDEPAECRAGDVAGSPSGNPAWADLSIQLTTADDLFHETPLTGLSAGTLDLVVVCRDLDRHETAPVSTPIVVAGPTDAHLGLAGHWTLDEGAGALAADSSGNGRDGTVAGATWATSPRGGALEFTASGDRVVVSNDATLGRPATVTMAARIRVDGGSGFRSIVDVRDGNIDGYDLFVSDTGRAFLRVDDEKITGATAIDDGAWHHVVGVYDGADLVLYVDGVEDARLVGAGALAIDVVNDLVIGDHFSGSGSYGFRGAIDEVRVYDRVLGVAEIQYLAAQ